MSPGKIPVQTRLIAGPIIVPIRSPIVPADRHPSRDLETFDNPAPGRDYVIRMRMPEFTCLCPRTGQPDFAELYLEYIPDKRCIELKSLKNYIWSFRDEGHFHEAVTNRILADLAAATNPRFMRLTGTFNVRGGIYTTVVAESRAPGWQPAPPVNLAGGAQPDQSGSA